MIWNQRLTHNRQEDFMKFLDREATIAKPGFNRWLVPPAALAVHLAIGQIYAYSVFNAPLTKLIGITESAAGDWKLTTVGWIFSIALAMLGASAACSVHGWSALGRVKQCLLLLAVLVWAFLYRRSASIRTICFCFIWATA